jgi:hypothetical protein
MTGDEFQVIAKELDELGYTIMKKKNPEYSEASIDYLANFRFIARELELLPQQVLYVYMRKHWASIATYCRNPRRESSEPIEMRLADSMNYHRLLYGLHKDV